MFSCSRSAHASSWRRRTMKSARFGRSVSVSYSAWWVSSSCAWTSSDSSTTVTTQSLSMVASFDAADM